MRCVFDVLGFEDDRLEFRVWAGDAGELTGNPALWQVRAELSAAMMLAGTDSAIYRKLDRLMGDPDLLVMTTRPGTRRSGWRSWRSSWSCCR
ncbi:hypothetical protein [Saccharopolyspora spinosa]|uniref:hypothetical protein n=1 Tax=Saccharopolyspora spinosa TaxID=60894 RepID=UPI00376EDCA8